MVQVLHWNCMKVNVVKVAIRNTNGCTVVLVFDVVFQCAVFFVVRWGRRAFEFSGRVVSCRHLRWIAGSARWLE